MKKTVNWDLDRRNSPAVLKKKYEFENCYLFKLMVLFDMFDIFRC